MKRVALFLILVGTGASSGCSILVGNVKPVAEKATDYHYFDLSQENPDWVKLPSPASEEKENRIPDVAFQSRKTAAIISLNSACRPSFVEENHDLRLFTDQLLLGITEFEKRDQITMNVNGIPALQTTVQGMMNTQKMGLRAIVLKKDSCVYDLMLVSRPEHFADEIADFSRFVTSVHLNQN